MLLKYF